MVHIFQLSKLNELERDFNNVQAIGVKTLRSLFDKELAIYAYNIADEHWVTFGKQSLTILESLILIILLFSSCAESPQYP